MSPVGGFGPMPHQLSHFLTVKNEADRRYGIERYSKETRRLYGVLDKRLGEAKFVGGDISIGDFRKGMTVSPVGLANTLDRRVIAPSSLGSSWDQEMTPSAYHLAPAGLDRRFFDSDMQSLIPAPWKGHAQSLPTLFCVRWLPSNVQAERLKGGGASF